MKDYQGLKIIGIDNGYGNIKTANCCFPAGLTSYDTEPVFKEDMLAHGERYYLIGTGHKEFSADKTSDDDYYILTLAAIAREPNVYGLTSATVRLAVGLPLTWVSQQRDDFKAYLMRSRNVDFIFRGKRYQVEIAGIDVFPQGFAAVASQIRDFQGVNMLCDIGNGTMNIMFINDRKPAADRMFTEKYGTHQCMLAVRENVIDVVPVPTNEAVKEVENRLLGVETNITKAKEYLHGKRLTGQPTKQAPEQVSHAPASVRHLLPMPKIRRGSYLSKSRRILTVQDTSTQQSERLGLQFNRIEELIIKGPHRADELTGFFRSSSAFSVKYLHRASCGRPMFSYSQ